MEFKKKHHVLTYSLSLPLFQHSSIPLFHAGLIRLLAKWNSYSKGRPFIDLTLDGNLSMMVRNDLFHNRKPQS